MERLKLIVAMLLVIAVLTLPSWGDTSIRESTLPRVSCGQVPVTPTVTYEGRNANGDLAVTIDCGPFSRVESWQFSQERFNELTRSPTALVSP